MKFFKRKAGARIRHRTSHTPSRWVLLLLVGAAAITCWQFVQQQPTVVPLPPTSSANSVTDNSAATPGSIYSTDRRVYPYSVILGGVLSVDELRNAALQDAVVARHFKGFNYDRAHLVRVSEARSVYLSYRIGDRVYWTRHKIALHPGEMLITDGTTAARTRCGNRIAAAPLDAGSPLEPSLEEFEQPRAPSLPIIPAALVDPIPSKLPDPAIPEEKAAPLIAAAKHSGIPWFIPPVYIPQDSHDHPEPLAVTPEPGSLLLISSGLAAVYWRVRKAKGKF